MFKFRRSTTLLSALFSLLGLLSPQSAQSQVTVVSQATVNATIANGVSCTGSPQTFTTAQLIPNFRNIGQTSHLATATSGASQFTMEIDGIDNLGNVFRLSDLQVGVPSSAKGGLVLTALLGTPTWRSERRKTFPRLSMPSISMVNCEAPEVAVARCEVWPMFLKFGISCAVVKVCGDPVQLTPLAMVALTVACETTVTWLCADCGESSPSRENNADSSVVERLNLNME